MIIKQPNRKPLNKIMLGTALISALDISSTSAKAVSDKSDATIEEIIVQGKQDNFLKSIDATTTKMNVSIKDTGRSIVQFDKQKMDDLAIENIRQAFDYVAGFRGNGPAARTYTARGVRTSIDNVMVDGLRSLQGGEGGTGSRLPTTFNAETTTFLRGPAGLLYGAGVGGGLINITTKKPQRESRTTVGLHGRTYASDGGLFDRNKVNFQIDSTGPLRSEDILYRLIGQYTPKGDHFQIGRDIKETLIDATLTFKLGENTRITPRFEFANRKKTGGSGYADGVFESNFARGTIIKYGKPMNRNHYYGSPIDKGTNKSTSFSLDIQHDISSDWNVRVRARKNTTKSNAQDLYISDSRGLGNKIGQDTVNRKWVVSAGDDKYFLIDGAIEGKIETGPLEHHLLFGLNYRDMDVKFERNFQNNKDAVGKNTISAKDPTNQKMGPIPASLLVINFSTKNEKDTNIYLKDRVTIDNFTLVGGLAYVKQTQRESRRGKLYNSAYDSFIWDIGGIYAINENINIFATYSRSYDPVSGKWIVQYGNGKTDFKPVEGANYELGVKGEFLNGALNLSMTAFRQDRKNSTKFTRSNGVWQLTQLDGASFRSKGIEVDAVITYTPQLQTSVSYAFTRAFDLIGSSKDIQANNTPKHSLSIWNTYQFIDNLEGLRLGLGIRHESSRNDGRRTKIKLESYVEVDAGVYYDTQNWSTSLVVRNAFDKNRAEAGANWVTVQPNTPRSINLSVKKDSKI